MLGWAQGPRGPGDPFFNHPGHWDNKLLYRDISENTHISEFIPLVPTGCWGGPKGTLFLTMVMGKEASVLGTISFCHWDISENTHNMSELFIAIGAFASVM